MSNKVTIKDHGFKNIVRMVSAFKVSSAYVGFFGHGGDATDDLAARAFIHEYGSRTMRIPPRPFMQKTYAKHKDEMDHLIRIQYQKLTRYPLNLNSRSVKTALERLAGKYAKLTKETITKLRYPPNSDLTIERKGSSNPLIDTGDMRRAVTYRIMR